MLEVLQTGDNAVKTVRIRPPAPVEPQVAAPHRRAARH